MMKDPINTIRGIYAQYGFTYTAETEAAQRSWLAGNPQHNHGKHTYSMKEYGLKESDITDSFGPYLEYFKHKGKNLI